jgi:Fe-S cluster assembly protein SufD
VTQLVVGADARVEHVRFQDESEQAFHVGALRIAVDRNASLSAHSFAMGASLSRQNIGLVLNGPGLEAILNGLYVTTGSRLADHHMVVDHAQPHGASHEYFNGILADQSRGVFHGRILVRPGAQKTDAKQTNKNLLLSEGATVNTKPQLEIYADDVKCTHGATVGQLNPESVFYLRARGIPRETARRMLIHAFAGEIVERVQCSPIRQALDRLIWERLERNERVHLEGRPLT